MPKYTVYADRANTKEMKAYKEDPWLFIGGELRVKDEGTWLSNLQEEGITICGENGRSLHDPAAIREKVKTETLYLFMPGSDRPYGMRTGEDGLLEMTDEPMEVMDLRGLPNKPEKPVFKNTQKSFENTDRTPGEGEEILNIKIDSLEPEEEETEEEIVLTAEEKKFMGAAPEMPEMPELPAFDGWRPENEGPVSEEIPPERMPLLPEPMTGLEKFWDNFVSLFKKEGSERGKRYREELDRFDRAGDRYREWAESYNEALQEREEIRRSQEEVRTFDTRRAAFWQSEKFQAYVAQENRKMEQNLAKQGLRNEAMEGVNNYQDAERRYEVDMDRYNLAYRKGLARNHVMAAADIHKNGLTLNNIGAHAEILGNELAGKTLSEVSEEALAEYLFARSIGDAVRTATENNVKSGSMYVQYSRKQDLGTITKGEEKKLAILRTDYRKEAYMLADFNDPVRHKKTIDKMLVSPSFRELIKKIGKKPLDSPSIQYDNEAPKKNEQLERVNFFLS